MNEMNGIEESKLKQSRRQGESAPEIPVGRAYAVESLAVGKVLTNVLPRRTTDESDNVLGRPKSFFRFIRW